jgi:hypothetical protein
MAKNDGPMTVTDIKRWEKECLSKKRIPSEDRAKESVAAAKADGKDLDYYRCPMCGLWHVTKTKAIGHRYKTLRVSR